MHDGWIVSLDWDGLGDSPTLTSLTLGTSATGADEGQARARLRNGGACAAREVNERLVCRAQSSKECSGHGKVDRRRELAILFEQRP